MKQLLNKYVDKIVNQGLSKKENIIFGAEDVDFVWAPEFKETKRLKKILASLNITSLLFVKPLEPYFSIINILGKEALAKDGFIKPEDTETRTFLHQIPVVKRFSYSLVLKGLKQHKGVIIPGKGIITFGSLSPEQAFINFSSICFSTYVKFFTDYFYSLESQSELQIKRKKVIDQALQSYEKFIVSDFVLPSLEQGPLNSEYKIKKAMVQAGELTVRSRLVDSFFGNVSCFYKNQIYISQTSSSLDELDNYIVACPLDNSRTTPIIASSEFSAHKKIYQRTKNKTILHGHPKMAVIISMLCEEKDCSNKGKCHLRCSRKRFIDDIPIVPGEVGTGSTGLCQTLPQALKGKGAIVYGHGLFTVGKIDFTEALNSLIEIEINCLQKYKEKVGLV